MSTPALVVSARSMSGGLSPDSVAVTFADSDTVISYQSSLPGHSVRPLCVPTASGPAAVPGSSLGSESSSSQVPPDPPLHAPELGMHCLADAPSAESTG